MKYKRKRDGYIAEIKLCLTEHAPSKGNEYFGYYWEENHIRLYEMKTVSELELAKEFEPIEETK